LQFLPAMPQIREQASLDAIQEPCRSDTVRQPPPFSTVIPMPHLLSQSALGLSAILFSLATVPAQSLSDQVREMIRRADQAPQSRVWEIGRQMSDLGEQEEALAKAIGSQLTKAGKNGRLAAAAALQEIAEGTEYGKTIYSALLPLLKAKADVPTIRAALALASRDAYFSRQVQPDLQALIKPLATNDLGDPQVRIAAARALWRLGTTEDQAAAKRVLVDFVRSGDRQLQIMGALALADINAGSTSPGWAILQEIAAEPSEEGQLARAYINIENQRRTFDAMLRQLAEKDSGEGSGKGNGEGSPPKTNDMALLKEIMQRVAGGHVRGDKITEQQLFEGAARGMLRSLDRHSTYFSSAEFQKFYFDLNPEYGGIGAFVNFDNDEVFSIVRPIYSGPAYEAALRSGDKILKVEGWDTQGHSSDEIISRLKGKPGTSVKINVFRRGWSEPKDFMIVRRKIQVPSVNHELLPGKVGYAEIVTFASTTAKELKTALKDLKSRGATSLVLDLRSNTGGYLLAAKEIVELFIPGRKLVVYTQGRGTPRQNYETGGRAIMPNIPLAVLINGYSASASEITAGAMQDHKRATVIGERSFGKGSVQTLMPLQAQPPEPYQDENKNRKHDDWEEFSDLNDNGEYDIGPRLKLTIAHYFLPSGRCVHKQYKPDGKLVADDWGVTPDQTLKLRDVAVRDRWKEAVVFDLIEKDVFAKYVLKHFNKAAEKLFLRIAEGDQGKTDLYPDFDSFYKGLNTKLPADDVRRWLRYEIRDIVSDLRGKAFPGGRAVGDFQEDMQLQAAIRDVFRKRNEDIQKVPAYKDILQDASDPKATTKANGKTDKK
jgi:C-terminal peptidase prc